MHGIFKPLENWMFCHCYCCCCYHFQIFRYKGRMQMLTRSFSFLWPCSPCLAPFGWCSQEFFPSAGLSRRELCFIGVKFGPGLFQLHQVLPRRLESWNCQAHPRRTPHAVYSQRESLPSSLLSGQDLPNLASHGQIQELFLFLAIFHIWMVQK